MEVNDEAEKQTAAEVLPDQGSGEVTEESLPLFPTPPAEPVQEFPEYQREDEEWKFDWLNDPSVILRDQAGVAAHYNRFGELVVKQRDTMGQSAAIYIAPENISKFLAGLRESAEDIGRRLGLTNAERQKLKLWPFKPIDATDEQIESQRKARRSENRRAKLRAKGVRSREAYLAELKET